MSLAKPNQNLALPLAVRKRLDAMLAGSTGLSGPEMLLYFSHHDPNIEQYSWSGGMPSRKQILQDCLSRFPREQQFQIIEDMLTSEIYGKYGRPTAEDRAFIQDWIDSQRIPSSVRPPVKAVDLEFRDRVHSVAQPSWDVFVSHASEDKEELARPLADALAARGVRVWYDDFTLKVGDSLRRSIDHGLSKSKFGVVVLSNAFFQKHWPQLELDGLVARESSGVKVILPIWHGIDVNQIREYSPLLADRLAVSSSRGIEHVVEQLMQVIRPASGPTTA